MTSAQAMNEGNRRYNEGRTHGQREGYKAGQGDGYSEAMEYCNKQKGSSRVWGYFLVFIIAFILGSITDVNHAEGASAQTTVTVTIGAEVPCNPTNCPEIPVEEPAVIENITQEKSLLQRMWSAILRVLT